MQIAFKLCDLEDDIILECKSNILNEEFTLNISSLHQDKLIENIAHFIDKTSGLAINWCDEISININQLSDNKSLPIRIQSLNNVILRKDSRSRDFVQIDFSNGSKVLLTQQLIGFKPYPIHGLDMREVPKVVTTTDLYKVFQAIEETLALDGSDIELNLLSHIFRSILKGGEMVGFDLRKERSCFHRLFYFTATA